MKRIKFYLLFFLTILIGLILFWQLINFEAEIFLLQEPYFKLIKRSKPDNPTVKEDTALPETVDLAVPFTSQAPYEIWDNVHKEACEEAAVLQAASFWLNIKYFTKEEAETQIQRLVQFEKEKFGYFEDTDTLETAQLITDFYQFKNVDVYFNITIKQIKQELAAGYPVIVPTAGQDLGNPFFRNPGPLYHMLVIRGYDQKQFITNDNGTKRGEKYLYDETILFNAIHDWNHGDIYNGQKAMIVIRS